MSLRCELWAVHLPAESERDEAFDQLKSIANERDVERTARYVNRDDGLRALLSRLLPRAILSSPPFSLPFADIAFKTAERGRPSLDPPPSFPHSFDYNCSHDNDYVLCGFLTSSPPENAARLGVDVMKLAMPFPGGVPELRETLADQLTHTEMADVSALPAHAQLRQLLRYWAHKEALVKATGVGLGTGLSQYAFELRGEEERGGTRTTVEIYEEYAPSWRFWETMVDETHLVVVAMNFPNHPVSEVPDLESILLHKTVEDIVAAASES